MDFMLVSYQDEAQWDAMPPELQQSVLVAYDAYLEEIRRLGRLRFGGRLQPSHVARTVRHAAGKEVITEGPFAPTKEAFAGFIIVDCQDQEEAVALSARDPRVRNRLGSVEVRPVIPEYSLGATSSSARAS